MKKKLKTERFFFCLGILVPPPSTGGVRTEKCWVRTGQKRNELYVPGLGGRFGRNARLIRNFESGAISGVPVPPARGVHTEKTVFRPPGI